MENIVEERAKIQRKKIVKFVIIYTLLGVGLLVGAHFFRGWYLQNLETRKKGDQLEIIDEEENFSEHSPEIMNIPPKYIDINGVYKYPIVVRDADSPDDEIEIRLIESPSWLGIEDRTIVGTPRKEDEGSHKIVIEISDGYNIVTETYYIQVGGNDNE